MTDRRPDPGPRADHPDACPELVVVGTSWGGLHAVSALLDALPATFAVPIAVIQHRGTRPSELASLLSRHTDRPVCEADDKDAISMGRVYLAPADYHLLIEHGRFALSTDEPVMYSRPSIDVCFRSAADAYGPGLVGVLLTGANADGAEGLVHIRARGGRVLVQDPATAERADMPKAALARLEPDLVDTLDALARQLVEWCS